VGLCLPETLSEFYNVIMAAGGAAQILQGGSGRVLRHFPGCNEAMPVGDAVQMMQGGSETVLMHCSGWGVVMPAGGAAQMMQGCSETVLVNYLDMGCCYACRRRCSLILDRVPARAV